MNTRGVGVRAGCWVLVAGRGSGTGIHLARTQETVNE
jgi:hypothetical protein